ncbi:MurR/RpiR family transcriptional regulator [Longispora fulva]|uniref:DNA-binding MurR/RpiR family transcriptional regulator n=1 Tax=Longispora fulva TaxID=619741 RepID=A0A8J7KDJ9_9ACTN|nr:MurR/RpiR family transcriptional regulator [Longispora fulva]MBG6134085.1 DNA-binding MurR/RpiR family transcriptional regulator [Longispora fulva]
MTSRPVQAHLAEVYATLPHGEQAVARVLLDDHPFAALGSLRTLAERAGVSAPTASRLVARLGFASFADFQATVRAAARDHDRSRLHEFVTRLPDAHSAAEDLRAGLNGTLAAMTEQLLSASATLLAEAGHVWGVGGPLSGLAAEYLVRQLSALRPGVRAVPDPTSERVRVLLDLGPTDLIVAYDFRRYSPSTAVFVRTARTRRARLLLITDAWESPLAEEAELLIRLPRDAAGPVAPLTHEVAVTELLLVATAARLSASTRLATLDSIAQTLQGAD